MTPYAILLATRDRHKIASAAAYRADETIRLESGRLFRRIGDANPGGWRMSQFAEGALRTADHRFVLLTLNEEDVDHPYPGHRPSRAALGFEIVAGTDPRVAPRPTWSRGPGFGMEQNALPMSGPLVDAHPALGRLAAVARGVASGRLEGVDFAAWRSALSISRAQHAASWTTMHVAIAEVAEADREAARSARPDLAARLKHHDWSHHESDMFIRSAADEERALTDLVSNMDLDEAALLMIAARVYPAYALCMLARHPALKDMRKAA